MFKLCLTFAILVVVNGNWTSCDGKTIIKSVICNGKDMKDTTMCTLNKGKNATLSVVFDADTDVEDLKSICHGVIRGVPIPFYGVDSAGCNGMKPGCPIKSGVTYTFNTKIDVKSSYPSLALAIKWEEQDVKTKKDLWCLVIPAKIV